MRQAAWASMIAVALGGIVGLREWSYHHGHRYAPGSSGDLFALGVAVVLIGAALAVFAFQSERQRRRELTAELERREVTERLAAVERDVSSFRFAVSFADPRVRKLLSDLGGEADSEPAGNLRRAVGGATAPAGPH